MGKRKGFTLVEVALFLAVTAALFIGIALGMNNAIYQQRRNDSVQNFLEYMKSIYSKVSNPQSIGAGQSDKAIYGKMVVFGESKDLSGVDVPAEESPVFMYDVVGNANVGSASGDVKNLLKDLNANVVRRKDAGAEAISPEKYEPRWGAGIENIDGSKFVGSIMVVRHPISGTINTLVSGNAIQVNVFTHSGGPIRDQDVSGFLVNSLDTFNTIEVDFCVNPNGIGTPTGMAPRQDIRIANNARNASSVKLIELDDKWSDSNKDGNRCYR